MAHAYQYKGTTGFYWLRLAMESDGRWRATASGPISILGGFAEDVCRVDANTAEEADRLLRVKLRSLGV